MVELRIGRQASLKQVVFSRVAPAGPCRYLYAPFAAGSNHAARVPEICAVPMARLVMKFGGTSVADIDRIRNVALHVKREVDAGHEVAVVVSAMSGTTNKLVEWCRQAAPLHDAREYDAVVATGEQVTSGLLAMTLEAMGVTARSWQGWQLPIVTSDAHASARILDINGEELIKRFRERKEVAVVSGFQGVHKETGRITTLGRGGSDTSAVAIAAAIHADRCDIYTDVDGVYTTDPRVVPRARRLDKVAFEEMLELASQGAKVLQVRSVELAMVQNVRIFVRSSFDAPDSIDPHGTPPGTLICDEGEIMEQPTVTGIAFSKDEAQISLRRVQDKPGVAAAIFGPLAEANINVDMIVQNVSADGATTDLTFTVPATDFERARDTLTKARADIGYDRIDGASDVTKVSVIGIGMRSHAGVAAQAFKALAERGINIRAITTSEIKFSLLIDSAFTELAVRTLHSLYGLDKAA
jgi:aspartate kinase